MAIDAVGDIVRVTVAARYTDSQTQMVNMSYKCTATGGSDSRGLLGALVYGYFVVHYKSMMSENSSLYGFKVSSLNKSIPELPVILSDPQAGVEALPYLPTQARPILRFRTQYAGQKYRGRLYLFSPATDRINTSGFCTALLNTHITDLGTDLGSPAVVGGSTWQPGIAHLTPGNPSATTLTPTASVQASGLFGTQRRSGNTGRLNSTPW